MKLKVPLMLCSAIMITWIVNCSTDKQPLTSTAHPDGWNTPGTDIFHGVKVWQAGYSSCKSCHGADLAGGEAGVACLSCHAIFPHPQEWIIMNAENFHGKIIRANNWSMIGCKTCHGEDFRGGRSNSSCYDCHRGSHGPESCNTCHGNEANAAPPEDLQNRTMRTEITIGAHQKHVHAFLAFDSSLTRYNVCQKCHVLPTRVAAPGHIDSSVNAEVLEILGWNRNQGTCSAFCHADSTYIWNN